MLLYSLHPHFIVRRMQRHFSFSASGFPHLLHHPRHAGKEGQEEHRTQCARSRNGKPCAEQVGKGQETCR